MKLIECKPAGKGKWEVKVICTNADINLLENMAYAEIDFNEKKYRRCLKNLYNVFVKGT